MKNYNADVANMLTKCLSEAIDVDFRKVSRDDKHVYSTTLLYKLLKDYNDMNDRMISNSFSESMGVSKNRSSIYTSLKKVDVYYSSHSEFRLFYDSFFKDKFRLRIVKEESRKKYLDIQKAKDIELRPVVSFMQLKRQELIDSVSKLPEDKLNEIKYLVDLRIKSWDWKSKDICEIIEGS